MKEFVDAVPKYIGVVSFLVLLVTVVHEYGYFIVLGSHLQAIATTYDYLANALVWLPTAMGAIFSLQGLEWAMPIKDGEIKLGGVFYLGWIIAALAILTYLLFRRCDRYLCGYDVRRPLLDLRHDAQAES